jgi:hypothetical protein
MNGARWWQTAVIYQIYPRSFQDSSGDGVGDLRGIAQRLDHLAGLGVDAIWLSPIFPSPMADFGYDISNYIDVDSQFGTLSDFDSLLESAHAHGIKLLLDLVPNHTSDQHPWFTESRSSRDNRRQRLGARPANRSILLPRLSGPAARPQLAQPVGPPRDARRHAVLASPRRRRLSRGCALASPEG